MSIYINEGYLWESEKVNAIFSVENKIQKMQLVEVAIAKAEETLGLIPTGISEGIKQYAKSSFIDFSKFENEMNRTGGHPVVAFLRAWQPAMDPEFFKYVHYGATTQDIMDTALILMLREFLSYYKHHLIELLKICRDKAIVYKRTLMAGRTHVQHAVPITFGQKWAVWLAELQRQFDRINNLESRLYTASFYGAAGNLASLGDDVGLSVTELIAGELDLNYNPVPWHTSRDNIIELVTLLANITTTLGKIANELQILSRNEVAEVEEPWVQGNVGSSTMPQKRNAFGLQAMVALSRICQAQASSVYVTNTHDHERDFKAYDVEEFSILSVCNTSEKALNYAIQIFRDLVVYEEKMRSNLDITKGLIMSESLMMKLAEKFDRNIAHEFIYDHAMKAHEQNSDLCSAILSDNKIMERITEDEVREALNPANYLGSNDKLIDAAVHSFDEFFEKHKAK